ATRLVGGNVTGPTTRRDGPGVEQETAQPRRRLRERAAHATTPSAAAHPDADVPRVGDSVHPASVVPAPEDGGSAPAPSAPAPPVRPPGVGSGSSSLPSSRGSWPAAANASRARAS